MQQKIHGRHRYAGIAGIRKAEGLRALRDNLGERALGVNGCRG